MSSSHDTEMSQDSDNSCDSDIEMPEDVQEKEFPMTKKQKTNYAEEMKTQGNEKYKQKKYEDAIQLYSKAVDMCPSCAAYYGNRAACYMMTLQFEKALADARKSTQIDPSFIKGYMREAKCHLSMGEIGACIRAYDKALQIEPKNNVAISELEQAKQVQKFLVQADMAYNHRDYRKVVFCMDRCLSFSPSCQRFKIRKAECLALIRRYQEAQEIANDILRWEGTNADAMYVRGLCLYYQDNIDKAFQHFQQVLRLAPDHHNAKTIYKKAKLLIQKKEEGNQAFRTKNLQEAHKLYTEALAIDPDNVFTNSKLYCNRATVSCKLYKNQDAVADCTKAIELDDAYLKAYLRRAKCYMDLEQYEEAVRDYETIFKIDKTRENRELLQMAKLELKKSKRKDFYKILGVGKNCTEEEIKKAYKKRALLHHPDRHAGATDEAKKEEERKFKEIGEAYSVLSDPKKKQRYDSGQDLDEMEGGGPGFHDIDPNVIFQSFFSGPGGGPPGGGGFSFGQQGFAPGGFTFQFG